MAEQDRDILIELRSDMKHVRDGIEHIQASDVKQWEKLDAQGEKLASHDIIIKTVMGITGSVSAGLIIWFATRWK